MKHLPLIVGKNAEDSLRRYDTVTSLDLQDKLFDVFITTILHGGYEGYDAMNMLSQIADEFRMQYIMRATFGITGEGRFAYLYVDGVYTNLYILNTGISFCVHYDEAGKSLKHLE